MTAQIILTDGSIALIDEEDQKAASAYRWHRAGWQGQYAAASVKFDGKWQPLYLHRFILSAPHGVEVDHRNGDKLDNRRENLRFVTRGQNQQNRQGAQANSSTGKRGVYWMAGRKKAYRAIVQVGGKVHRLGYFGTVDEAAAAAAEGRRRLMTHSPECEEDVPA